MLIILNLNCFKVVSYCFLCISFINCIKKYLLGQIWDNFDKATDNSVFKISMENPVLPTFVFVLFIIHT